MGLGDKAAALALAERAIAANPIRKTRSADPLQSRLSPASRRKWLDPMFDPLRNDPRFQKLVASETPKEN
jgi:hypothetical protein